MFVVEFPWAFDPCDDSGDTEAVLTSQNFAMDASVCGKLVPIIEPNHDESVEDTTPPPEPETPLFHRSPITVQESLAAVLSFVESEHLSGSGLGRLLSDLSSSPKAE